MGKKNKKFGRLIEEEEELDEEILEEDEEYAAVLAMRQEKLVSSSLSSTNQNLDHSKINSNNNSNTVALIQSLDQLSTSKLPFKELFQICEYDLMVTDENDDLAREMAFYDHSLKAVKTGRHLLQKHGIPSIRPSDYFCEHIKTDQHMARIKDRLILEEKKIEAFEQRKQRDFDRKFAKKVSAVKKTSEYKQEWKHSTQDNRSKSSNSNGKEVASPSSGSKRRYEDDHERPDEKRLHTNEFPIKSFKRRNMDKKYGFGGKDRKRAKLNDSKSLNDLTEFHPRGGKFVRRESGKGKFHPGSNSSNSNNKNGSFDGRHKGGNKKPNRPGKDTRSKMRKAKSS